MTNIENARSATDGMYATGLLSPEHAEALRSMVSAYRQSVVEDGERGDHITFSPILGSMFEEDLDADHLPTHRTE